MSLSSPLTLALTLMLWLAGAVPTSSPARPDEGMWPFDNLPLKTLKEKYNFEPTKEWLDHVRLGSVRFDTGGSGSFVSPNGLVMTNHHVALTTVQKISTMEHDYVKDSFSSAKYGSEVAGPDLTLRQLIEIQDVTKEVMEAAKEAKDGSQSAKLRADTVKKLAATKNDPAKHIICEPVTLYNASQFQLYIYKIFEDVRLVFAPEQQVAFFGGDPDNFTYPRFDLDCAFFRVYEDGKPLDTSKYYFKWNAKGAAENDLVFVSGNPGSTERLKTYSQLETARDLEVPGIVNQLTTMRDQLSKQMEKSDEQKMKLRDQYFGVSNSLKAYEGHLKGLRDPDAMARFKAAEDELIKRAEDPKVTEAFAAIAKSQENFRKLVARVRYSRLPGIVNLGGSPTAIQKFIGEIIKGDKPEDLKEEDLKPKARTLQQLAAAVELARKNLPKDDAILRHVFGDHSTEDIVKSLTKTSKIYDATFRAELVRGGKKAVAESTDPVVIAVRELNGVSAEAGKAQRESASIEKPAQDVISAARLKVYGHTMYPDATFTLRLSFGAVKGYEAGTTNVPYKTTFWGMFERSSAFDNKAPFNLPDRWFKNRAKLNLDTPLNFVCTADIIGGNSGSPVLNRDAEIVGLVFDGNIESLPGDYWFDEKINRCVSVHSGGMLEAIDKIYGEDALVKELRGS